MNYLNRIPYYEFTFEAIRSRGPGGQNVNKTNSAVMLYWNVDGSVAFNDAEKQLIRSKLTISASGNLIVRSEALRSQDQNKSECLKKLDRLITQALKVNKKRFKTKPTYSSKLKKLNEKKIRKDLKSARKKVQHFNDD